MTGVVKVSQKPFLYQRRVSFYETDSMGVVHHTNYLRYFEEARVHWLRERGLIDLHIPRGSIVWAVLETQVRHHLPLYFDDPFEVRLRVKIKGIRTQIDYFLFSERHGQALVCEATTVLVPLGSDSKPCRPPRQFTEVIKGEPWIEI